MIHGFENETAPLNEYEQKQLVPIMVRGLMTKIGKDRAVKNASIVKGLKSLGYDISEARVRKIISHIRVNGLVKRLIATSAGYYISNDRREVEEYIESLRGRENAIKAVREALEKQQQYELFN